MPPPLLGGLLVLVLLAPGGCTHAGPPAPPLPLMTEGERQVFSQVNRHRALRGLPPLAYSPDAAEVARRHSEAMASGRVPFSHEGLADRAALVRRATGNAAVAENLVTMPRLSEREVSRAVRRWLQSSSHRRTLEGRYDLTGVGVARAEGGQVFVTQLFVQRAPPVAAAGGSRGGPLPSR